MFISIEQIKAARALLGWTQKELAEAAGLNLEHVANYESGRSRALSTLEAIHQALVAQGVIFIDDTGVNKTRPGVRELRGQEGFWDFYDDIYETIKAKGGSILVSGAVESVFWHWLGDRREAHRIRMSELKNFDQKIIVKEGALNIKASYETTEYRLLPEKQFSGVPFYLYGDKLAIINFEANDVQVFIIEQPNIARAYEKTFYALWDMCKAKT